MVLESNESPPASGPLGHAKNTAAKAVSGIQRMYGRLLTTWENGSMWVALVFGMMYLPSVTLVLLIDTTIVASGAGIGEQVVAAIAFVVGFLAVLEIVLISYLVAPQRTEVLLRPLHEWARAHNRHILFVFFVLIAIWQLARGFSLA
jgi:predicted metal-binding membrane protein